MVDRRQHGGIRLVAVMQHGVGIALMDRRADERGDVIREPRVGGRDRALDAQGRGILREVKDQADDTPG